MKKRMAHKSCPLCSRSLKLHLIQIASSVKELCPHDTGYFLFSPGVYHDPDQVSWVIFLSLFSSDVLIIQPTNLHGLSIFAFVGKYDFNAEPHQDLF